MASGLKGVSRFPPVRGLESYRASCHALPQLTTLSWDVLTHGLAFYQRNTKTSEVIFPQALEPPHSRQLGRWCHAGGGDALHGNIA